MPPPPAPLGKNATATPRISAPTEGPVTPTRTRKTRCISSTWDRTTSRGLSTGSRSSLSRLRWAYRSTPSSLLSLHVHLSFLPSLFSVYVCAPTQLFDKLPLHTLRTYMFQFIAPFLFLLLLLSSCLLCPAFFFVFRSFARRTVFSFLDIYLFLFFFFFFRSSLRKRRPGGS